MPSIQLNELDAEIDKVMDEHLAGRVIDAGLRKTIIRHVRQRARANQQPAFSAWHVSLVNRFAADKNAREQPRSELEASFSRKRIDPESDRDIHAAAEELGD